MLVFCSVRLSVRSPDFQSGKTGSTPVPSTNIRVLPPTADCKSVPEGREVKARGALPSAPTIKYKYILLNTQGGQRMEFVGVNLLAILVLSLSIIVSDIVSMLE